MVELNGRYDVGWLQVSVVISGRIEGLVPQGVSIPSVISSTSPLSPKHLAGKLRQQRGYDKIRRSSGGGGGQQPDPGLRTWQRAGTYWVNFHVGEPGSASTIVAGRGGVGEGRPSRYDGTLAEGGTIRVGGVRLVV